MKLNNKGRVTPIELVSIIVIIIGVGYILMNFFGLLNGYVSNGNDSLYANTAESVAKVNSLNGINCPVNDCGNSDGTCMHHTSLGYIGYFDSVTNTIVGEKVKGYNSDDNPDIDGVSYTGIRGTMILRITCENSEITLDWVSGS